MRIVVFVFFNCLITTVFSFSQGTWNCGDSDMTKIKASLYGTTLTIRGTGKMMDYSSYPPWRNEIIRIVEVEDGVTSIGENAFRGCDGLKLIVIGRDVHTIKTSAFDACDELSSIEVNSSNPYYTSDNNVLFNKKKTKLVRFPQNLKLYSYSVPISVDSIGDNAFSDCMNIVNVIIPNSVVDIGDKAFSRCLYLTSISIPNSVKRIGLAAFQSCADVETITIGENVEIIKEDAFKGCSNLTTVNYNAIYCTFYGATFSSLKNFSTLNIGDQVKYIVSHAFEGCQGLKSISIPSNVTTISNYAFSDCTGLTSLYIPNGVTSIGFNAFSGCSGIKSLFISNSVENIGNEAFSACSGLTDITIGRNVSGIGEYAFYSCLSLKSIALYSSTPPKVQATTFAKVDNTACGLYVFRGNVDNYINSSDWNKFTINSIDEETWECGFPNISDITARLVNGSLIFEGHGKMKDFEIYKNEPWWYYQREKIYKVTMNELISCVGSNAFIGCNHLESVELSNNLVSIEEYAFYQCSGLSSITFPNSVKTIANSTFSNCNRLTYIKFGNGIESIGDEAFEDCKRLDTIYCHANTPPIIYPTTFQNASISTCSLYVPARSSMLYQNNPWWGAFYR